MGLLWWHGHLGRERSRAGRPCHGGGPFRYYTTAPRHAAAAGRPSFFYTTTAPALVARPLDPKPSAHADTVMPSGRPEPAGPAIPSGPLPAASASSSALLPPAPHRKGAVWRKAH